MCIFGHQTEVWMKEKPYLESQAECQETASQVNSHRRDLGVT